MHPPIILSNPTIPGLFCKPSNPAGFLYYNEQNKLLELISFQSLDLQKHLPKIHKWVNMSYTKAFWQMEGSYESFHEVYQKILDHPNAHSFVGFYGKEMVCQLDIYMIGVDELSWHIPEESHHCGFHLLMAPNNNPVSGLTLAIINAFLQYFFSFPQAQKMYAEPDIRNQKSICLLKNLAFAYLDTLILSYKTAHLYCLTRQQFLPSESLPPGD